MIKMNLKEVEHIRRRTSKYSVSGSKRCNKSSTNDNDTMSMKHILLLYMQLENYVINNVATSPSLQYSKCYISEKWNLEN